MTYLGTRTIFQYFGRSVRCFRTSLPAFNYKSAISLDKLYPASDLNITKVQTAPKTEGLNFSGYVPMDKMKVSYSCSSGPGGQNVNRVNTKVDLRFNITEADWLSGELKEKVSQKYKSSITNEGFLVVRSDKTRSQQLNLADAIDKLRHMIHTAAYAPPPLSKEIIERNRRRHEASVRERLRQKKSRSLVKQGRQDPQCDL